MQDLILKLTDFQATLNAQCISEPINFQLKAGEVILLEGPNGSGKSTVMRAIAGLLKQYRGQYTLHIPHHDLVYQPQSHNLSSHLPLSVGDVVTLGTGITLKEVIHLGLVQEELTKHDWNSASGGERQLALITRSILLKPKLLLLDEPFNHLDAHYTKAVLRRLGDLHASGDLPAMIIIAHREECHSITEALKPKVVPLKSLKNSRDPS